MNRRLLLAGVACALAAPANAAQILGRLTSVLPGGGFSVSGRDGKFLTQVARRSMTPGGAAGETAKGFTPGEYQSARLSMPTTEGRVSQMLDTLGRGWPYAKPPAIRVHMIASGTYGPLAMPDGSISVPVGLIALAQSDDEVALLLGHEYGHLALGHFARDAEMKGRRALVSDAADLYSTTIALSQLRVQQSGQRANLTLADRSRIEAAANSATRAKDQLDWVLNVMVEPAWNRNQEDEADAAGFDLSAAAGYSPLLAAPDVFSRLTADDARKDTLIKSLEDQIESGAKGSLTDTNIAAARSGNLSALRGAVGDAVSGTVLNVIALGKGKVRDYFSATHRPPAQRQAGLAAYCDAAYGQSYSPPDTRTTWLTQVRATPEYRNALEAVTSLQAAQEARTAGNLEAARTAIARALRTPYGTLPLILNESARIYRDAKNFTAAETEFTRADTHREQTLDGFSDHVQMCVDRGNYPRALAVIEIFRQRSGTDQDFLPQLVRIRFKQGQTEEALKVLNRCMDTQQPSLRERCARNAFGPDDAEWAALPPATQQQIQTASNRAATRTGFGLGGLLDRVR